MLKTLFLFLFFSFLTASAEDYTYHHIFLIDKSGSMRIGYPEKGEFFLTNDDFQKEIVSIISSVVQKEDLFSVYLFDQKVFKTSIIRKRIENSLIETLKDDLSKAKVGRNTLIAASLKYIEEIQKSKKKNEISIIWLITDNWEEDDHEETRDLINGILKAYTLRIIPDIQEWMDDHGIIIYCLNYSLSAWDISDFDRSRLKSLENLLGMKSFKVKPEYRKIENVKIAIDSVSFSSIDTSFGNRKTLFKKIGENEYDFEISIKEKNNEYNKVNLFLTTSNSFDYYKLPYIEIGLKDFTSNNDTLLCNIYYDYKLSKKLDFKGEIILPDHKVIKHLEPSASRIDTFPIVIKHLSYPSVWQRLKVLFKTDKYWLNGTAKLKILAIKQPQLIDLVRNKTTEKLFRIKNFEKLMKRIESEKKKRDEDRIIKINNNDPIGDKGTIHFKVMEENDKTIGIFAILMFIVLLGVIFLYLYLLYKSRIAIYAAIHDGEKILSLPDLPTYFGLINIGNHFKIVFFSFIPFIPPFVFFLKNGFRIKRNFNYWSFTKEELIIDLQILDIKSKPTIFDTSDLENKPSVDIDY